MTWHLWIFAKLTPLDLGFWAGSGRSWQAWWILVGPNQAKLVEASSQFRHREDPRSRIQNLQVHPAKTVGRRGTLTTRAGSWILDLRLLPNMVSFALSSGSWILDSGNACQRWQVEALLEPRKSRIQNPEARGEGGDTNTRSVKGGDGEKAAK